MRAVLLPLLCLMAACSGGDEDAAAAGDAALIARDPVIARALHDPLMSDPDLASRNEANAALGFPDSQALPVFAASSAEARAAREALRLELLNAGAIPDLPPARKGGKGLPPALGPMASGADLIAAVGAPAACAAALREDFALAASLPAAAALPPRGMVVQAGGADAPGCALRIIRYHSAAAPADVLQWHYARALRAGLTAQHLALPEGTIIASGKGGERLTVQARAAAHGLTGVDLIYRAP